MSSPTEFAGSSVVRTTSIYPFHRRSPDCALGTGKLGDGNPQFSPLLHLRDSWGVSQIDGVIITHPHRDHLDDVFNFDSLHPRTLERPDHLSESDIRADNTNDRFIDKYLEIDRRYSKPVPPALNPFEPANNGVSKSGRLSRHSVPLPTSTIAAW